MKIPKLPHAFVFLINLSCAFGLASLARADYASVVLADHPAAYYRFNDSTIRNLINNNIGTLGSAGNASNDLAFVTGGIVHPIPGAIAGDSDQAEFFDYTTRTEIPFSVGLNTTNSQSFTVEGWIYPVSDQAGDLGGSNWIYLAGTYDGANWRLYRNGALVATTPSGTGALPVPFGDWTVGATGEGWGDNFNGAIDEVAIYNTALSTSQIASHYSAATTVGVELTVQASAGGNVVITWPSGATLQQFAAVNGPYTDVPNSLASPLTVSANGTKFYRWRR